jgi:hypothetical protein
VSTRQPDDQEFLAIAGQEPDNIDEALVCMQKGLDYFHKTHDRRAIFLRLYYMMTLEVHAAINSCGDYEDRQVFMDPAWVFRLSGKFSTLYFKSLVTPEGDRAWRLAYEVAERRGSSVVENGLLGINAHINFDLPRAIAKNLEGDDLSDFTTVQKRKFDHDQVNNLLVRTLNPVQRVLARDYEPGIAAADWLLGSLDEKVSAEALRHYRERVWWDAIAYAAAPTDADRMIVRNKLEWQSYRLAKRLSRSRWVWGAERALNSVVTPLLRKRWAATPIAQPCRRADAPEAERPLGEIGRSPMPA